MRRDIELLKRRLNVGPKAEKESSQKIIQTLARISFISIMIIPGLDHHFGWSVVPLYLTVTGDAFVAAGFFIVFLVFRENTIPQQLLKPQRTKLLFQPVLMLSFVIPCILALC